MASHQLGIRQVHGLWKHRRDTASVWRASLTHLRLYEVVVAAVSGAEATVYPTSILLVVLLLR